jgi:hypothetical protein
LVGSDGSRSCHQRAQDNAGQECGDDPHDHAPCAASSSQMGRFETEWLATNTNLETLADLSGTWIDGVHERKPPRSIILDMDSSESPTASRRSRPGTVTSAAPAIIHCSCSTSSVIWSAVSYERATSTVPRIGA